MPQLEKEGVLRMEMVMFEVALTDDELKRFVEICVQSGVCPAVKIGQLVHGFVLSQGVIHRKSSPCEAS